MLQITEKLSMAIAAFIRRHPRLPRLVIVRSLAASLALGGCVPATSYEQANSAAQVEREGHRRTAAQLAATEAELAQEKAEKEALASQKAELERRLASGESELAQVSLEREHSEKTSEQQSELVTQLRGELARVGDHLKAFEGDKDELRQELSETQALLTQKDRQIALLEAQIERLKQGEEKSADAQQQLSGALEDLAKLQQERDVDMEEPADDIEEPESPDAQEPAHPSKDAPANAPTEGAEEVLPSEEG